MQTRSSDDNSVRLSVRPSVCLSGKRVLCDKMVERSVHIFADFQPIFARSASAVTSSEKSLINANRRSITCFPMSLRLLLIEKILRYLTQNWHQCNFGLFLPKFGCLGSLKNSNSIFEFINHVDPTMHAKNSSISCTELKFVQFWLILSKFGCRGNSLGFFEILDSIFEFADPENPTIHYHAPKSPKRGLKKRKTADFRKISHIAWRKSATKFLCVKTVSDKVVRLTVTALERNRRFSMNFRS